MNVNVKTKRKQLKAEWLMWRKACEKYVKKGQLGVATAYAEFAVQVRRKLANC